MNQSSQAEAPEWNDDEIDLRDLLRVLWEGKWIIGGVAFSATVIAVIVALMLPNIYRAEALLAPNDQDRGGGLSALAAQYGGLASLAGIDLGGGSSDKTALGLEILQSRQFVSDFIERRDILVPLMAAEGWDEESRELKIDSDVYDVAAKSWVREARPPKKNTPSMQEAHEEFMEILSVSRDKTSGFVTIAVDHYSPDIARQWVDWLVEDINSTIMLRDVAEAQQAIEFLYNQIEKTSVADLQNVFFNLIEEQTKIVLLANVTDEYLLRTLDPAVAPEERLKPNRRLIVLLGMVLGGVFGILVCALLKRR